VELELTGNDIYEKSAQVMSLNEYKNHFLDHVLHNPEIGLHYARFCLKKGEMMDKLIAVDFTKSEQQCPIDIKEEENIELNQFLVHLYRRSSLVKSLRWSLEVSK